MLKIVGASEPPMDLIMHPWLYCTPMSTAIVKIYTPEGFVVAADGKTSDGRTDAQKVFEVRSEVGTLACCLSNCADISDAKTGVNIRFDSVCSLVAAEPRLKNADNLQRYADIFSRAFGKKVQEQVLKAKEQRLIHPKGKRILKKGWKTDLHFAGYFKGSPSITMSTVRFHGAKVSVVPCVTLLGFKFAAGTFYGSERVLQALREGDARFAQYASPFFGNPKTASISNAIDAAKKYIEACSSLVGREFDPDYCNSIGGDIRTYKIMLSGGFELVDCSAGLSETRQKV